MTLCKTIFADWRGSPAGFEEVSCDAVRGLGEGHVTRNREGLHGAENGPWLTASKEVGTSVLHLHKTKFCKQLCDRSFLAVDHYFLQLTIILRKWRNLLVSGFFSPQLKWPFMGFSFCLRPQ